MWSGSSHLMDGWTVQQPVPIQRTTPNTQPAINTCSRHRLGPSSLLQSGRKAHAMGVKFPGCTVDVAPFIGLERNLERQKQIFTHWQQEQATASCWCGTPSGNEHGIRYPHYASNATTLLFVEQTPKHSNKSSVCNTQCGWASGPAHTACKQDNVFRTRSVIERQRSGRSRGGTERAP
jgi:hypothetical protein